MLRPYLGAISLVLAALAGRNETSSVAEAILMGSAMAAITAITISTMLRFTLHRSKPYFRRIDLIVGSVPLFLIDITVVATLIGLLMWCTSNLSAGFATYMGIWVSVLIALMMAAAAWAWKKILSSIYRGDFNTVETNNVAGCGQVRK
ncbi:unnamed protein product [Fusarium graminearum]|uniref:Uncharacterized protein n=1 Tax=Gibberella zeae TaxID=5518 RepID=A0A4E9EIT1_GIBZA|nr:unnamed protein product [Fusarium graminearum]